MDLLRTGWHELAAAAFAVPALLVLFLARMLGAHWNLWFLWLGVATALGVLLRVVGALRAWRAPPPWSADATAAARAQAGLRALAWLLPAPALWMALLPIQLGDELAPVQAAIVGLSLCGVAGALWPVRRRAWVATVALALVGATFTWDLATGLRAPDGPTVPLRSPFDQPATVFHGGGSTLLNHHAGIQQQRNALDLVLAPNGSEQVGDPATLEGWACFGAPLVAPAAGEVVHARDDRPDMPIGETDAEVIEGNHVTIRIAPDRYVLLAHLQQGSVTVAPGDRVAAGDPIGRCGNSGNTSQPHLHLQVQSGPDFSNDDPALHTFGVAWAQVQRGDAVLPQRPARRNDVLLPGR